VGTKEATKNTTSCVMATSKYELAMFKDLAVKYVTEIFATTSSRAMSRARTLIEGFFADCVMQS
jgi:hypothetical protein